MTLRRFYSGYNYSFLSSIFRDAGLEMSQFMPRTWFPSQISLNIVGNGHISSGSSLVLSADHKSYIFNCGEGFQRSFVSSRTKLKSYQHVFITSRTWKNLAGLPGLIMYLDTDTASGGKHRNKKKANDANQSRVLNIHGPTFNGLYHLASHISESKLNYGCKLAQDIKHFEDEFLKVEMIPIIKKFPGLEPEHKKSKINTSQCYAYLLKTKEIPGKLLVHKCKELKIPVGPLLSKLKSGEDIILEDGTVIKSSDVLEPSRPGKKVVLVECLTEDYLDSLLQQERFFEDQESPPEVVVHFTPPKVALDPRYHQWMSKFPSDTVHLALNRCNPFFYLVPPSKLAKLLRRIDEKLFVDPYYSFDPDSRLAKCNLLPTTGGQIYRLHPDTKKGLDLSFQEEDLKELSEEFLRSEIVFPDRLDEAISVYKEKVSQLSPSTHQYPAVVFLGTGSAQPSGYRNSSCILVEVNSDTIFMLDCGEGTLGQLYRFYGLETEQVIKRIKGVFLSHFHADHQIGFINFVLHRKELGCKPINLFCSSYVQRLYKTFSDQCESIENLFNLITTQELVDGLDSKIVLADLGLSDLRTCRVQHCVDSYAIVLQTEGENSKKIAYSGDALPSKRLVEVGKNCDLLIHEATFEDSLKDEAIIKNHSTTSQALKIGKEMRAKFTILTHFSQRYYKLPVIPEDFPSNAGFAFDNMRLEFGDLPRMALMLDSLKLLFFDDHCDLEKQMINRENLSADRVHTSPTRAKTLAES